MVLISKNHRLTIISACLHGFLACWIFPFFNELFPNLYDVGAALMIPFVGLFFVILVHSGTILGIILAGLFPSLSAVYMHKILSVVLEDNSNNAEFNLWQKILIFILIAIFFVLLIESLFNLSFKKFAYLAVVVSSVFCFSILELFRKYFNANY